VLDRRRISPPDIVNNCLRIFASGKTDGRQMVIRLAKAIIRFAVVRWQGTPDEKFD
jgi:hypothetical protein